MEQRKDRRFGWIKHCSFLVCYQSTTPSSSMNGPCLSWLLSHAPPASLTTFQHEVCIFWGDGRQGLKQEVKVSPQLSFSFSWKPKQTRHHICALPLSYQKQGGQHDQIHALKWSDKGIQQHSWHIPFSSRLTSWGHSTGCMPVTWHLKLCPVLVPISPHYNDQGDSISVPPQHFKKLYISHQIKCH